MTTPFKEAALLAHSKQVQQRAEDVEANKKKALQDLQRTVEKKLGCFDATYGYVLGIPACTIEGITFHLQSTGYDYWSVLGDCPTCGEKIWSDYGFSIAHIGAMLTEFTFPICHACAERKRKVDTITIMTTAKRLELLIREIAREEAQNEIY